MNKGFQLIKYVWKVFLLLLLILITFSYAMFQGGFVSWFLFYSFLPFALYGCYISLFSFKNFTVERGLIRKDYQANEELLMNIVIKRNNSMPLLFFILEDCLDSGLAAAANHKNNKKVFYVGFQKEFEMEYRINRLPRGEHEFQSIRIYTCDFLGLIEKEKYIPTSEKILVYPALEDLPYGKVESLFELGTNSSIDRIQRESTMVVGIRDYQPGDRFSWINWKASAKRDGMVSKEFEKQYSQDVLLVMDCVPEKTFESIVSFTGSLGQAILRKGSKVGLFAISDSRIHLPVNGGESTKQQMMYQLAKVNDKCTASLHEVLQSEKILLSQKAAIMVITAHLSRDLIEQLSRFTARKLSAVVFVMKEEGASISELEQSLRGIAARNSILVTFVHQGKFSTGLLEVRRA